MGTEKGARWKELEPDADTQTPKKRKEKKENKEQNLIKSEEDNYVKVCINREEKKLKTAKDTEAKAMSS